MRGINRRMIMDTVYKNQLDYYTLLGVPPNASAEEIEGCYKILARFWHPDRNLHECATKNFQLLGTAYGVLRDPKARELYNSRTKVFSVLTGSPDLRLSLELDLAFLFTGGNQCCKVTLQSRCSACKGPERLGCKVCRGKGFVVSEAQPVFTVPKGLADGTAMRLLKYGNEIPGASEPGDLIFVVKEKGHKFFTRSKNDLHLNASSLHLDNRGQATFICTKLDGSLLTIALNASTLCATNLHRIKGQGFPIFASLEQGDLYVHIQEPLPDASIDSLVQTISQVSIPAPEVATHSSSSPYCHKYNLPIGLRTQYNYASGTQYYWNCCGSRARCPAQHY